MPKKSNLFSFSTVKILTSILYLPFKVGYLLYQPAKQPSKFAKLFLILGTLKSFPNEIRLKSSYR